MIKIAAISGLIIAGITIFMGGVGPCDPYTAPKPPLFCSPRGDGLFGEEFSKKVRDIKNNLTKPSDSIKETAQSSSSASLIQSSVNPSPSVAPSGGTKTRMKAAFSFDGSRDGSLRKSSRIEIRGNVSVEIKEDGTSSENLFDWLPLKVVLKVGGKQVWETEVAKKSSCKEYLHNQSCILTNFVYDPAWDGKKLYLYAYDKNNEWLAFHYEE